jgi:hypothetical protein
LGDLGLLEASLALPRQGFAGADLYPGLIAKAAALGFSLIQNHPFGDENKHIGHAALAITRAGAMGRKGAHKPPIGLGAEGKAKGTAAADALEHAAAAAGGTGIASCLATNHRSALCLAEADDSIEGDF